MTSSCRTVFHCQKVFSEIKVKFSETRSQIIIMAEDDRQLKYINVGMEFTNKVTKKIMENLDEDEQSEQLEIMRNIMKDYIKMEHEYNVSKKVLARIKKGIEVESADMERDVDADYRDNLKTELENDALTDNRIVTDHRYTQLESIISGRTVHTESKKQCYDSGAGGNTTGDDDLIVTEEDQTFIDPWNRKPITDPLTNR